MNTDLQQKSDLSKQNLMVAPDFANWKPETLAKFAHDANQKLKEQEELISQLQADIKTALAAYRAALKETK